MRHEEALANIVIKFKLRANAFSVYLFSEGGGCKTNLKELPPLKMYRFPLTRCRLNELPTLYTRRF